MLQSVEYTQSLADFLKRHDEYGVSLDDPAPVDDGEAGRRVGLASSNFLAFGRRLKDEHGAGWLPAKQRDALKALSVRVEAGDDTPTNRMIAADAQCSPRTVRRMKKAARERHLLRVEPRYATVGAFRRQQLASRYVLLVPSGPVFPKPRAAAKPDAGGADKLATQADTRKTLQPEKTSLNPGITEIAGITQPKPLKERRLLIEERLRFRERRR